MTILNEQPGYKLWLDDGKLYDQRGDKVREITGISKDVLMAIYAKEAAK